MRQRTSDNTKPAAESLRWLQPDELKAVVRDKLISMSLEQQGEFIHLIDSEMKRVGLRMRAHLMMIGIPGTSAEELTPNDIAHLVRFLKISLPEILPVLERALFSYTSQSTKAA